MPQASTYHSVSIRAWCIVDKTGLLHTKVIFCHSSHPLKNSLPMIAVGSAGQNGKNNVGVTGGPGRVWGRRSKVQEGASRDRSAGPTGSASRLDGMRWRLKCRKGAREVIEGCPAARGGRLGEG